jgi:hypothetical protein
MSNDSHKQPSINGISSYVRIHKVSLGLFLAAYGAFYLMSVVLSGWTLADWGKNTTLYPPSIVNTLLPRSFIDPIFFITGFPALLIGAAMLCVYSIRGITAEASVDKQYVAILLAAFGFGYVVIGAWPLGQRDVFPWEWQKQIISWGPVFAWLLYLLSLVILVVGAVSLYKNSVIYHKRILREGEKSGEALA